MVAHDVLDDARYAHAPSSEDADDTIKTVSYIGTDEDWLAVVNPWKPGGRSADTPPMSPCAACH